VFGVTKVHSLNNLGQNSVRVHFFAPKVEKLGLIHIIKCNYSYRVR